MSEIVFVIYFLTFHPKRCVDNYDDAFIGLPALTTISPIIGQNQGFTVLGWECIVVLGNE